MSIEAPPSSGEIATAGSSEQSSEQRQNAVVENSKDVRQLGQTQPATIFLQAHIASI